MKNVVFLGHSTVAHLDKARHTGALNQLREGASGWAGLSHVLDTSIMLDTDHFNTTFCHSLNGKKSFKLEDIIEAREWIVSSFAGADAFVFIIGGNDVARGGLRNLPGPF